MIRPLLIAAAFLCAGSASGQSAPGAPDDQDAPRSTSGGQPSPGASAPPAQTSTQETIGAGATPPPTVAEGEPGAPTPRRRAQQTFISPFGEPFHAPLDAPYPVDDWFARVDTDHDGSLSKAEFAADGEAFFKRLDENHDGRIDGFENGDYETKVAPEIQPRIGGLEASDVMTRKERLGPGADPNMRAPGGRYVVPSPSFRRKAGPYRKGAGAFGLLDEPQPVRAADSDLNFRVSSEEWAVAIARRFATLDLNHDGRIDRAEIPLTPVQEMAADAEKRGKRGFLGLPRGS